MSARIAVSAGSRLVSKLAQEIGAAELGRRIGTSEGHVRHLGTGRRTASADLRARLALLGIPEASWGEPATDDAAAVNVDEAPADENATVAPVARSSRLSGIVELRATIAMFDRRIAQAENASAGVPSSTWTSLLRGRADACAKLAKLQNEDALSEAEILASPVWAGLLAKMAPTFTKYPHVAQELAAALDPDGLEDEMGPAADYSSQLGLPPGTVVATRGRT